MKAYLWGVCMKTKRSIILRFLLFVLLFSVMEAQITTVDAIFDTEKPKIIFGDKINYPPFSYLNERGQPSGFNVELAKAIGDAMGYEVEVRLGDWSSIREALDKGEIDVISGMFYSVDRTKNVDFSSRLLILSSDIFTKTGVKIKDVKDLKNEAVIVQQGGIFSQYLKSLNLNIQLVEVSTVKDGLLKLKTGEYKYACLSRLPGLYTLKEEKITGICAQGLNLAPSDYCMAVKKGNEKIQLTLNSGLQVLKATGEYNKIYEHHLGIYEDVTFTELVYKYRVALVSSLLLVLVLIGTSVLLNYLVKTRTKELQESNQSLKLAKQRYQSLFDNMTECFALYEIICDANGTPIDYRFLEVNQAFERATGLRAENIINRTVKEVLPGTEQYWIDQYGDVALHDKKVSFEKFSEELGKHLRVSVFSPKLNHFATVFTDISEQVKSKEDIEFERKLLETILEDALFGYWNWDLEHNEEYLSQSFKEMFGYADHELKNSTETWKKIIFQEDLPSALEHIQQHIDSHGEIPYYNEVRYRHKNGSTVWVLCSGRVVEWDGDKPLRMVGCHINITELKNLQANLHAERNLFKTTLHSLGDGVISTDKEGNVDLMNAVAEELTGWKHAEAKGMPFETVFHIVHEYTGERCPNPIKQVFESGEIMELANHTMLIKKNGEAIPIEDSAAPIKDEEGTITGVVFVFRDFTDKKEKQERIKYLSHHDQLTTLYNRNYFEEQLDLLDREENLPFTLVMADVNGLKLTNDAFGHKPGDELLKRVATILKRECRAEDIVARVGGDEFVILLPKTNSYQTEKIINRIYASIERETQNNVIISVSFGWETKESRDQPISEVFSKAEEHMYRKKLVESQSMRNQTIRVIMQTLRETNIRERIHSEKVSQISRSIGEAMRLESGLLKELETAALMHDIGKIAMNESVLNKAGNLTDLEYEEIKRHPEIGYHILKSVDVYTSLADYVLSHHERWDGTGYPRGLSGDAIPLISRIIAVADAFEAMIGDRPYRNSMDAMEAVKELERCSGSQFDPDIVEVFSIMQLKT